MPAFLTRLPAWVLVVAALLLLYAGYRYWKYRKANAYTPDVARGTALDFSTPRTDPKNG